MKKILIANNAETAMTLLQNYTIVCFCYLYIYMQISKNMHVENSLRLNDYVSLRSKARRPK